MKDPKNPIFIEPSIFSADFGYLADEAKRIEEAGGDGIHFDIMDGHFVPNLSLSPKALAAVNRATDLFLDVHIMVYNPFDYIEGLVENGADCITFHMEASENVEETLDYIRKSNVKAGLAFCPETAESFIPKFIDKCDKILFMTVRPGFGGQEFMPEVLRKVEFVHDLCIQMNIKEGGRVSKDVDDLPFAIQVDGGVNEHTAPLCIKAGANHLVSGNYLFRTEGTLCEKIQRLKERR